MHALQDGYLTGYGCKQVTSKKYTITGGLAVKRLKAGLVHAKIRFGPRTGWLPCMQSVGKSSLWLIGSFSPETSAPGSPGLVRYNMQGSTSTIIPPKKKHLQFHHFYVKITTFLQQDIPRFTWGFYLSLPGLPVFFAQPHRAHHRSLRGAPVSRDLLGDRRDRGRRGLQDLGFAPFAVRDPRFGCWPVRLMRFWVHGDIAAFWNENGQTKLTTVGKFMGWNLFLGGSWSCLGSYNFHLSKQPLKTVMFSWYLEVREVPNKNSNPKSLRSIKNWMGPY